MYLGITIVTHDFQPHDSKVIVPAKTKVRADRFYHDNSLRDLNFDKCYPTDYFDPHTRHVYLMITPEEHNVQLKE